MSTRIVIVVYVGGGRGLLCVVVYWLKMNRSFALFNFL
jgi:hypothetical protein